MVAVNMLAVLLPINGMNTGQISDLYPSWFTPAGFTFGIWSVIYLWLLVFTIAQWFYANRSYYKDLSILFIASCMANLAWIVAWHYLLPEVALVIMLILLFLLLKIFSLLSQQKLKGWESFFIQYPYQVYLGWISVATIANVSAVLVNLHWYGSPFSQESWTVTVLIVAVLLAMTMIIRFRAVLYSFVTVWALYGIFVRWKDDSQNIIAETSFVLIVLLMLTIVSTFVYTFFIQKRKGQRIGKDGKSNLF